MTSSSSPPQRVTYAWKCCVPSTGPGPWRRSKFVDEIRSDCLNQNPRCRAATAQWNHYETRGVRGGEQRCDSYYGRGEARAAALSLSEGGKPAFGGSRLERLVSANF